MKTIRKKLFSEEESIEKVCKLCEKKFSNRASEYCSSECANKSMV
ncbi:hypothetical protein [Candidatus Nitrosopumilus sp. SW]|nr:hypothetical protein [Candidatus Nitrosopumilus sp. SW]